jgi:hypothetical protein
MAPIALSTAYCLRFSVVNMYSMMPVTPKPTDIAKGFGWLLSLTG